MIFAASIISGRALQPIDQVIGGWRQFAMIFASWRALKAALAQQASDAKSAKTLMQEPQGHIAVQNVLVLSPNGIGSAPILNRINFDLAPGAVLGVVGPSGSGKSTLARLIVGVQKPSSGTIRIDGTEVQNWNNEQLGRSIGYLSQDVELLPGTVKENIARLSEQPDDLAVLDAARKAQVHSLIQNLPQGYDTRIGLGGLGLSGGQRQRIDLARALYDDPKIMVLDEPNANLDDDGELALRKALAASRSLLSPSASRCSMWSTKSYACIRGRWTISAAAMNLRKFCSSAARVWPRPKRRRWRVLPHRSHRQLGASHESGTWKNRRQESTCFASHYR